MNFEYNVLTIEASKIISKFDFNAIEAKLNQLGQKGWELVGTEADVKVGSTRTILLFLKKEAP